MGFRVYPSAPGTWILVLAQPTAGAEFSEACQMKQPPKHWYSFSDSRHQITDVLYHMATRVPAIHQGLGISVSEQTQR